MATFNYNDKGIHVFYSNNISIPKYFPTLLDVIKNCNFRLPMPVQCNILSPITHLSLVMLQCLSLVLIYNISYTTSTT